MSLIAPSDGVRLPAGALFAADERHLADGPQLLAGEPQLADDPQLAHRAQLLADPAPATASGRSLQLLRTVAEVREAVDSARRAGRSVGFVPTMGALHAGHLSLIAAAREHCEFVLVSVFVNPSQFDEQADLLAYPREEAADASLAAGAGADALFVPSVEEVYRPGFQTWVQVLGLTDRFEGAVRGARHFRGMATIVCKLLNVVAPDVAYFGQKDAQQAAVVKRMVADLDMRVRIETMPTVREPDGLAMSSRNRRLSGPERERALGLYAALKAGQAAVAAGERSCPRVLALAIERLEAFGVDPEYLEVVDEQSFQSVTEIRGASLLLVAARIGQTRLIDNVPLRPQREAAHHIATAADSNTTKEM